MILCHFIGYPEAPGWTRRWRAATYHEAVIMATLFPRVGRREAHGPCPAVPCSVRSYSLCGAQQPDESGWTFKDPSWHTSRQREERRGGNTRALPRLQAGGASFPQSMPCSWLLLVLWLYPIGEVVIITVGVWSRPDRLLRP